MDRRKLLTKLRRAELLELPIFTSRDSSKTVPQLRIKLSKELARLKVSSHGARVGELLKAYEKQSAIRNQAKSIAEAAAEKVSQIQAKKNQAKAMAEAAAKKVAAKNKAIDDAFFKQLRESTPTYLTDYSKYKGDDKKFYQKWFSKYVRHFKKNEGVKVCITDNAEKSKALETSKS